MCPSGEILAIDHSAYVCLMEGLPTEFAKVENLQLLALLEQLRPATDHCVIEQIASYGGQAIA